MSMTNEDGRIFSRRALLAGFGMGAAALAVACGGAATPTPVPAKPAEKPAAPPAQAPAATTPATAAPTKPAEVAKPADAAKPAAATKPAAAVQPATAGQPAPAAMNPAAAKGKELRMLAWAGYKGDGIATWLPDYEKELGGKVTLDLVPGNNLTEKQIVVLSAKTGEYDVTTVDESNVPAMNPFLLELTPLVQRDKLPVDDWIPVVWAAGTW